MISSRVVTLQPARRLVLARQHLDGAPHPTMLDLIRDLGCLQLDPISAVARSHQLVLWSRLGAYDLSELDHLLWHDRSLFEYWAHEASIVLTEHFPLHHLRMRHYPSGESTWSQRIRKWVSEEQIAAIARQLRDHIHTNGPIASRHLDKDGPSGGWTSGWTSDNIVNRLIYHMWHKGEILVAGREGNQRLWHTAENVLPEWTPRDHLEPNEVTRQAAQIAVRALGIANTAHIKIHFIRRRYHDLERILAQLETEGVLHRVSVANDRNKPLWKLPTYIHAEDLPLLDRIESGDFVPRTTLLSPFDNLICDRKRTQQLFNFDFGIEIYVPKNKRKYGYYVLPILHGDRLIGRIDPLMDRKQGILQVNSIYAEPDAPDDNATVSAIRTAIENLATFLNAKRIEYGVVPDRWRDIRQ